MELWDRFTLLVAALGGLWLGAAIASHAWHTIKFRMIKRIGPPTPPVNPE